MRCFLYKIRSISFLNHVCLLYKRSWFLYDRILNSNRPDDGDVRSLGTWNSKFGAFDGSGTKFCSTQICSLLLYWQQGRWPWPWLLVPSRPVSFWSKMVVANIEGKLSKAPIINTIIFFSPRFVRKVAFLLFRQIKNDLILNLIISFYVMALFEWTSQILSNSSISSKHRSRWIESVFNLLIISTHKIVDLLPDLKDFYFIFVRKSKIPLKNIRSQNFWSLTKK